MDSGILLINKTGGMTSHDVVDAVRRATGEQRVGHAGTLDPFATGVLVVGVGREATRVLGTIASGTAKQYHASIRLGATSETDDPEGPIHEQKVVRTPSEDLVLNALKQFRGDLQQTPPPYSSVKIGGVRAYRRARRGEQVALAPRSVTIYDCTLASYQWPTLVLDISCSVGTYVRSLARDIGKALGTGAYCEALVRTAVGHYTIEQTHTLEAIAQAPEKFFLPIPTL